MRACAIGPGFCFWGTQGLSDFIILCLADAFDIVAVRVQYEGGIVVRMIVVSNAGWAVIAATSGKGGCVKRIDSRPLGSRKPNMYRAVYRFTIMEPQSGVAIPAKAVMYCARAGLHRVLADNAFDAKRCQRGFVKAFGGVGICYGKFDVIQKHAEFPFGRDRVSDVHDLRVGNRFGKITAK